MTTRCELHDFKWGSKVLTKTIGDEIAPIFDTNSLFRYSVIHVFDKRGRPLCDILYSETPEFWGAHGYLTKQVHIILYSPNPYEKTILQEFIR